MMSIVGLERKVTLVYKMQSNRIGPQSYPCCEKVNAKCMGVNEFLLGLFLSHVNQYKRLNQLLYPLWRAKTDLANVTF
jgi:hypothetical protein